MHTIGVQSIEIIPGNQANPSFSFPIASSVTASLSHNTYVGAGVPGSKEWAISVLSPQQQSFMGVALEKVSLDGSKDSVPNPLFNAQIKLLSVMEVGGMNSSEHSIVVTQVDASRVFLSERANQSLISVQVPDATNVSPALITSEIVALASSNAAVLFAAVKPHAGGDFGDPGSGIALLGYKTTSIPNALIPLGRIATSLDTASASLKIGEPSSSVFINNNAVALHWDSYLARLFIGLQVQNNTAMGARAIVVARVEGDRLVLEQIAPDNAFVMGAYSIVGRINGPTSVHQINTMRTSTGFTYLIVRGGNDVTDNTHSTIYALPVVQRNNQAALIGTIAAISSDDMSEPAAQSEEMTTQDSPAAFVGGGVASLWGTVTNMTVNGDTIFISTRGDGMAMPGVFYSQALFDSKGHIKRWTLWRRYAGIITPANSAQVDNRSSLVTVMSNVNADAQGQVMRTSWGKGTAELSRQLIQALGPVERMADFPALVTPGLRASSVLGAVYNDTVTLVQTGTVPGIGNKYISPTQGHITHTSFDNGIITEALGADPRPAAVTIRGGVLADISPVTEIAVGGSGSNGWIFCGGDRGLAVLSTPDGRGWVNLGDGFAGLTAGMSFKKIGNYEYIRRLVIDGNYLYVLTDTALDRIAINTPMLISDQVNVTRLAQVGDAPFSQNGLYFNDTLISDKLALLGTSKGLFRVGDGRDVTRAVDIQDVNWTVISVPGSNWAGSVARLYGHSTTGRMQDCARDNTDGHLYVLSSDRSQERAQINRFSIESVETNGVTDKTIKPLPDGIAIDPVTNKRELGYYANLGELWDAFGTEGTLYFVARGQESQVPANLQILPLTRVPSGIEKGRNIPSLLLNSATGTWLVGNEGGVHTNE